MLYLHTKFEDLSLPTCRDILISSIRDTRMEEQVYLHFFKAGVILQSLFVFEKGFPERRGQILHAVGLLIQAVGCFDLFCTHSSSVCTAICHSAQRNEKDRCKTDKKLA